MATLIQDISEFEGKDEELISTINRFGNPTSILLLSSPCHTFHDPEIDGLIGYQLSGTCAVVLGDPLCAPQDILKLTQAFDADCRKKGLSIIYLLVSESFAHSAIQQTCKTLLQVADQLVLDPTQFKMKPKLRWKIQQSQQSGVVIKEYGSYSPKIENRLQETMQKWQKGKKGHQIYLGSFDFSEDFCNRRIFFAELRGEIIGVSMIYNLPPKEGWVLTALLALSAAPVGVTEHLMSHVLNTLMNQDCHYLFLGFAIASKIGEMEGISPFLQSIAQWGYQIAKRLFNLDAKRIYLNKYQPEYLPTYILCSDKLGIKEALVIKNIFNVKL